MPDTDEAAAKREAVAQRVLDGLSREERKALCRYYGDGVAVEDTGLMPERFAEVNVRTRRRFDELWKGNSTKE